MIWNIPSESAWDMLFELYDFIEQFPESPLVPVYKSLIDSLERKLFLK